MWKSGLIVKNVEKQANERNVDQGGTMGRMWIMDFQWEECGRVSQWEECGSGWDNRKCGRVGQ